jgi:hypothetical protein
VQHCLGEQPRNRSMTGVTAWLRALMPRIAKHPEALQWYEALTRAYDATTKAIDIAPERIRAGKCPGCAVTLYTYEGREDVTCKPCAETYNVAELQADELEKIMSFEANAALIIKALDYAGTKIKFKTLTSWADRGHVVYTETAEGREFRVSDVLKTHALMSA